jgi:hypothetical protein
MIVQISSDAEQDIADGFWFYEGQTAGLSDYFRSCLITDIESLTFYGGIHEQVEGYHRSLSRRFPFTIYYIVDGDTVTVDPKQARPVSLSPSARSEAPLGAPRPAANVVTACALSMQKADNLLAPLETPRARSEHHGEHLQD